MAFKYFTTLREVFFLATHPKLWLRSPLSESVVPTDPYELFNLWYGEAKRSNWFAEFPNAMVLSTISPKGVPQGRIVLLKGVDKNGFVFYTNKESQKGVSILANPHVALTFYWDRLQQQVRIEGVAHEVSAEESDSYFHSRPRDSQIGAWASRQSTVLAHRSELEEAFKEKRAFFGTSEISRPPYWGGYRVIPAQIEFWQLRLSRLHDRIRYFKDENQVWQRERLAP